MDDYSAHCTAVIGTSVEKISMRRCIQRTWQLYISECVIWSSIFPSRDTSELVESIEPVDIEDRVRSYTDSPSEDRLKACIQNLQHLFTNEFLDMIFKFKRSIMLSFISHWKVCEHTRRIWEVTESFSLGELPVYASFDHFDFNDGNYYEDDEDSGDGSGDSCWWWWSGGGDCDEARSSRNSGILFLGWSNHILSSNTITRSKWVLASTTWDRYKYSIFPSSSLSRPNDMYQRYIWQLYLLNQIKWNEQINSLLKKIIWIYYINQIIIYFNSVM